VDNAVFKPVATVYNKILPWFVRKGVNNFFKNINTIPTIINDMLQGSLYHTAADTTRLVVNTTLGIGGLIDVATAGGVAPHKEDFGLTLDRWGYKSSAYFVIPILGPSTVRDTIGLVMDYNVFNIYLFLPWRINFALWAINAVDVRAQLLEFDDVLKQASLDPYTFQRNAYLQHRAAVIAENDADLDGKAPGEIGNDSLADSYVP
jgi:phospholipid-binding lipoprotein MlaA